MTYANRADPAQTAPTLFAIPQSILSNRCMKSKISAKIVWNKVFEIFGHLLYKCILCHQSMPSKNYLRAYVNKDGLFLSNCVGILGRSKGSGIFRHFRDAVKPGPI